MGSKSVDTDVARREAHESLTELWNACNNTLPQVESYIRRFSDDCMSVLRVGDWIKTEIWINDGSVGSAPISRELEVDFPEDGDISALYGSGVRINWVNEQTEARGTNTIAVYNIPGIVAEAMGILAI